MKFSIKILESDKQISNEILNALIPEVNTYLKNSLQKIRSELPSLIMTILQNTDTYTALMGGQLQYEFGIPDPSNSLKEIFSIWSNNIKIDYKAPTISNNKIKGSFSVSIIRSDFADVLSSDASLVIDNLRGYSLPWLEWLLLDGNQIIVPKQQVVIGPNKNSRTGFAIMRESNKAWRVPSQFAGTITNNWITRAIDDNESIIDQLLQKAFEI